MDTTDPILANVVFHRWITVESPKGDPLEFFEMPATGSDSAEDKAAAFQATVAKAIEHAAAMQNLNMASRVVIFLPARATGPTPTPPA